MCLLWLLVAVTAANAGGLDRAAEAPLFPFVLPWNDASPGIANLSGGISAPAGLSGHIRAGADGQLLADELGLTITVCHQARN